MEKKLLEKEIRDCKVILENPSLKYSERRGLEIYLQSMEQENGK
jgi:hypothetical protein